MCDLCTCVNKMLSYKKVRCRRFWFSSCRVSSVFSASDWLHSVAVSQSLCGICVFRPGNPTNKTQVNVQKHLLSAQVLHQKRVKMVPWRRNTLPHRNLITLLHRVGSFYFFFMVFSHLCTFGMIFRIYLPMKTHFTFTSLLFSVV